MNDNPKEHEHWQGIKNRIIRYYFYCNKGLDTFNSFRYIVMMIFGIYWALKLKNPWWLLLMFGICLPTLTVIGYISIHHINKVTNWLDVRFGSHYSLLNIMLLQEIRDALTEKNKQITD